MMSTFVLLGYSQTFPFSSYSWTMCFNGVFPGYLCHLHWVSVCPHLLSQSRHHHRHLSSGCPPQKSLSLRCWDLRSCHLNCQSLWMCLICRGGQPSVGGWDMNTQKHAPGGGKSKIAQTHVIIWMHEWHVHKLFMYMHVHESCTVEKGQRRAGNTETAAMKS